MSEVRRRPPPLLIKDVEVDGAAADVLVAHGFVVRVGLDLTAPGVEQLDGSGGALLPGLHDHHAHLLATAAARSSIDCGVADREELRAVLRGAAGGRVRGIGYSEDVAGLLDRDLLDELEPSRPVRVQHRSGALWALNTRGLEELHAEDVEDGRLWRGDPRLVGESAPPDLTALGAELAGLGVLGVTDATPDLSASALALLVGADLPQELLLLGAPTGWSDGSGRSRAGPEKVLLHDEHDLDWEALVRRLRTAHASGRAVAVHSVTRGSLVAVVTALQEVGTVPGDRIEHAAVVPDDLLPALRDLAVVVVTQPALAAARGDSYLRDVDAEDVHGLWRWASLSRAGIPVVPSSDAPYGPMNPWSVLRAARDRSTPGGAVLGRQERVPVPVALDRMLAPLDDPGAAARRVSPGAVADLVLLHHPLSRALEEPSDDLVRMVLTSH